MTKLEDKYKIREIWEMGRNRAVPYQRDLLKIPTGINLVIDELSKTYQLGIVTNRIRRNMYESSEVEKLKDYFEVSVTYEDTEKHKPDPEPLLLAASKLGIQPSECVYIGDVETDVQAGHAAGMKVIAFSKERVPGADAATSEFGKIPELIEKL